MLRRLDRYRPVWRRTAVLGWPIGIQQFLGTLMRTVDVVVTGLISPAAVAAVGLADLYANVPRQIGSSLGTGAIALASQDTGRSAAASRDAAILQSLLLAVVAGLPFVVGGLLLAEAAIAVLGASAGVVRLGATYLAVILVVAPARIVGVVGAAALQGTGDTRTPMLVNGAANLLNIAGTVGLGLGVGSLPALGVLGVGLATAGSRVFEAVVIVAVVTRGRSVSALAGPGSATVARQLLTISAPRLGEQLSTSVVSFPFNAVLLTFGTEVVAAYHVGRRVFQQIAGPLYRTYGTVASILVGQRLGAGAAREARFAGLAIGVLGVGTVGVVAAGLLVAAPLLGPLVSDDAATVGLVTEFTRTYAVASVFLVLLAVFAGALRGAGETRTPLVAQFTGQVGFMLGFSYLVGVVLGGGVVGVYLGIVLAYAWGGLVVGIGFYRGGWADRAAAMIAERASVFE